MQGAKIAIGGKGGVGKTTVSAIWAQLFAQDGFDVLAIDADPDTNLCSAFGVPADQSPEPLIRMKDLIAERTGTTKDSVGVYFTLNPKVSDLPEQYWLKTNGVKVLVLGGITRAGGGCACPEGAFLKSLLTHTILQREELVLVDLAAGVEFMGRASVQGTDALVLVVEPGARSIETAKNMANMARKLGIQHVGVIANKVTENVQMDTIKSELGDVTILGTLKYSRSLQEADMRRAPVFGADPEITEELKRAKDRVTDLLETDKKR
jgi:CO dehydrogenase maturation factor